MSVMVPRRMSPLRPYFVSVRAAGVHRFSRPTFRRHCVRASGQRWECQSRFQRTGSQTDDAMNGESTGSNLRADTPWSMHLGTRKVCRFGRQVVVAVPAAVFLATGARPESSGPFWSARRCLFCDVWRNERLFRCFASSHPARELVSFPRHGNR